VDSEERTKTVGGRKMKNEKRCSIYGEELNKGDIDKRACSSCYTEEVSPENILGGDKP